MSLHKVVHSVIFKLYQVVQLLFLAIANELGTTSNCFLLHHKFENLQSGVIRMTVDVCNSALNHSRENFELVLSLLKIGCAGQVVYVLDQIIFL